MSNTEKDGTELEPQNNDEKYHLKITLKGLPQGGNSRLGWKAKYAHTMKWKRAVASAVRGKIPPKPLKKVKLRYTRCSCSSMDWDNLVISFKPVQDGLVEQKIFKDDTCRHIPEMPIYQQRSVKRGEGCVIVELWEV